MQWVKSKLAISPSQHAVAHSKASDVRPDQQQQHQQHQQQPQVAATAQRKVRLVMDDEHAIEGPGFEIQRPFPTHKMRCMDPFLLLDEFGPKVEPPNKPRQQGLGAHPHRGQQLLTYMVRADYDHYDSTGKHGRMRDGDVQLLTAGGGVVHGGAPSEEFRRTGGVMHGFQIWINLPAKHRMARACTVDFKAALFPTVTSADGLVTVKVLAGEALGVSVDVITTMQPIVMMHYIVQPGGSVSQALPADYNVLAHVGDGAGLFGPSHQQAGEDQTVFFEADGCARLTFSNPASNSRPLDVLILGGRPTNEPFVQHGPFVVSSKGDLESAMHDYRTGRMGRLYDDGTAELSHWAA